MVRVRVRFVGTDVHREYKVEPEIAEQLTTLLHDPDAVLTIDEDNGTTYAPVRNITYLTVYTR